LEINKLETFWVKTPLLDERFSQRDGKHKKTPRRYRQACWLKPVNNMKRGIA